MFEMSWMILRVYCNSPSEYEAYPRAHVINKALRRISDPYVNVVDSEGKLVTEGKSGGS
jgi:hypothetical protein